MHPSNSPLIFISAIGFPLRLYGEMHLLASMKSVLLPRGESRRKRTRQLQGKWLLVTVICEKEERGMVVGLKESVNRGQESHKLAGKQKRERESSTN